ncbi:MAG: acetylxylan esterase [Ruminococcaceae bacterium]|nr:acetylxylan esterase [Oscillospiraceae bacterium]
MLKEILEQRKLPDLLRMNDGTPVTNAAQWPARRRELLEILQTYCYGITPPPVPVHGEVLKSDTKCNAGKATQHSVKLTLDTPYGPYSYPLEVFLPKNRTDAPLFLLINFRPDVPDRYFPVSEILDNGFAAAMLHYNDITPDKDDFTVGLAGLYIGDRERRPDEWGQLGMWAWGASRALDWLLTFGGFDPKRVYVTGHSRLGKTALWCAAQDERFALGISNDSGCGGAALERGKIGEHVQHIPGRWFCPNYKTYKDDIYALPFDHHFVTACCAPRCAYIASAKEDCWADPHSEFLAALAASPAFELCGLQGLVYPHDVFPTAPATFHEGNVAYHIRTGCHQFAREDWLRHMEYARLHFGL